jgi:16S rRNA (guanine966-N2)-methyltransferase
MKPRQLRVIGGKWRGRKFDAPPVSSKVRPTQDAVRETLFNWLRDDIINARCLDLFAGSGSLGIEALSRGAQRVDFVEADPATARLLQHNLDQLGLQQKIFCMDARRFIRQIGGEWDVVFLDPPFYHGMLDEIVRLLGAHQRLLDTTLLYLESERQLTGVTLPHGWAMLKQKQAGQVSFGLAGRTMEFV